MNHIGGMCKGGGFPCYAYRLANGRLKARYLASNVNNIAPIPEGTTHDVLNDPFYPRFWEDKLLEPVNKLRRWGRNRSVFNAQSPKGIFVCSMSDLFGIGIPEEWTRRVLDKFQYAKQHRFYLLTKQPQNLQKFQIPDNAWVGVSATDALMFADACYRLRLVEAKVKYISFEPLLQFEYTATLDKAKWIYTWLMEAGIKWVIIGAQTKPNVMPKIEWVREIIEAADKAGIPVFLKDSLYKLLFERPVKDHDLYWATMSELRQEIPSV